MILPTRSDAEHRMVDVVQTALRDSGETFEPSPGQIPDHVRHRVANIAVQALIDQPHWRFAFDLLEEVAVTACDTCQPIDFAEGEACDGCRAKAALTGVVQ